MARTNSRQANETWEALLWAHTTLMKRFAAADVWHDLTMREYDVLYTLAKCQAPVRLSELNRHVLLSQPALSRMVERLVSRGLVERSADSTDRRGSRLCLTDDGAAAQRRIGRRHGVDVARAVTASLTDNEMVQLERLCHKLIAGTGAAEHQADERHDHKEPTS